MRGSNGGGRARGCACGGLGEGRVSVAMVRCVGRVGVVAMAHGGQCEETMIRLPEVEARG